MTVLLKYKSDGHLLYIVVTGEFSSKTPFTKKLVHFVKYSGICDLLIPFKFNILRFPMFLLTRLNVCYKYKQMLMAHQKSWDSLKLCHINCPFDSNRLRIEDTN